MSRHFQGIGEGKGRVRLWRKAYPASSQYFCHQIWRRFPHTKQFCYISWTSCGLTQFWHHMLGDSIRSHRFRILHPSSGASHKSYIPRIHNFCATQLQSRGSDDPLAWIICYNSTQNLGKSLIIFTSLLKNTVKDTDEPPDAETHRAGSGRVLNTQLLCDLSS